MIDQPVAGLSILVVEDDPVVAQSIQVILESKGHRVFGPVATVDAACAILQRAQPDLALIDYRLASFTTEPLLPDLQERGIPTCVLTGYAREQLPRAFARTFVLEKPFSMEKLLEAIDVMLEREEAADSTF